MSVSWIIVLLASWVTVIHSGAAAAVFHLRSSPVPYQPYTVSCSGKIVRTAHRLNSYESSYIAGRKRNADTALETWLQKTWNSSIVLSSELPTLALALSGGGPKAGLLSAGIVQALDSRENSTGVNGLLQSMNYVSALSGGSLTLSGIIGNDFAQVSHLKSSLYNTNYPNFFLLAAENDDQIAKDLKAKASAGFSTSIIDIYGRLLGYDAIGGDEGANGVTMSGVTSSSAFASALLPYPIIQGSDAHVPQGQCVPSSNGTLWEFTPYEFGSWDVGIKAFIPMRYLGSSLYNGIPSKAHVCASGFDNLGFIAGTSANIFATSTTSCSTSVNTTSSAAAAFEQVLPSASAALTDHMAYGLIPNPFSGYGISSSVNQAQSLYMTDGGLTGQGLPLWALIQPQRSVDIILAGDVGSDGIMNITSGNTLSVTYAQAQLHGLSKMPRVPNNAQIQSENLTSRASFFGCYEKHAVTIIYLPDTYSSMYSATQFSFSQAGINSLIGMGNAMAEQLNDPQWPTCVACAIMKKKLAMLPAACDTCFRKYCWTG